MWKFNKITHDAFTTHFIINHFSDLGMVLGESIVFYTKKVDEKISSLERNNFSQKHKKVDSIFT
jgi:hypothetical protein